MYQYWLMNCRKCTTLMQVVNSGGNCVQGQERRYGNFLCFLLNFSINLKLLLKWNLGLLKRFLGHGGDGSRALIIWIMFLMFHFSFCQKPSNCQEECFFKTLVIYFSYYISASSPGWSQDVLGTFLWVTGFPHRWCNRKMVHKQGKWFDFVIAKRIFGWPYNMLEIKPCTPGSHSCPSAV